ncbi:hypothetical protein ACIBSV_36780 [Embleya sp. NPDC050154]
MTDIAPTGAPTVTVTRMTPARASGVLDVYGDADQADQGVIMYAPRNA